ncbi:Grap2 and cyclin-D-interacting-domain-containing protein, partial [Jimgerdemannia flammicorona]
MTSAIDNDTQGHYYSADYSRHPLALTPTSPKLKALADMCLNFSRELQNPPSIESGEFDTVKFKYTIRDLATVLINDATKLTIACKPPYTASAAGPTIATLGDTAFRLAGFVESVPASCGRTYVGSIRRTAGDALRSAVALCNSFLEIPVAIEADKKGEYLISTGQLWEACKHMQEKTPADNREAVAAKWRLMTGTLEDGVAEVEEFVREQETGAGEDGGEEEEEEDGWDDVLGESSKVRLTKEELAICVRCVSLFKLTRMLCKKVLARCILTADVSKPEVIAWLDQLGESGAAVADAVDEFGASMYASENVVGQARTFVEIATELVHVAQSFAEGEHAKWFE